MSSSASNDSYPIHKSEEFHCDACSLVHEQGISYKCTACLFFRVHLYCVSLRVVKLPSHRHTVRFAYSISETQFGEPIYCHVCRQHLKGQSLAYHCARCRYYFHIFNCRSIQHFSHEDPLVLVEVVEEEKDGADAESKSSKCGSCRLKISVPCYVSTGYRGMFLLHKFCAELPDRVQHYLHPGHKLTLGNLFEGQMCDACHEPWDGFSYSCFRGSCSFSIDIICALKNVHSQHKFHKHPLTASHTKGLFSCSACYIDSDGPSYKCTTFRFWVHYQCGSAPLSRKHDMHPHLLKLTYSIQESAREDGRKFHCHVCREEMQPRDWAYHCAGCKYYIHARNCSETPWSREIEEFDHEAALAAAICLPPVDGESVNLAMLFFMNTNKGENSDLKQNVEGINAGQTLFLDPNETCHVCAALLAAPCNNCALCNYFLPKSPAELDDHDSLIRGYYSMLKVSPNQTCNGFGMSFGKDGLRMKISSSVLPRYVKHEGHRHVLLTTFITEKTWCNACEGDDVQGYAFRCNLCKFTIHTYCATFPGFIRHRYDKKHSFKLTYYSIEGVQEYLCEVCEGDITTMWFYHCAECDLSIHPRCIWRYFINFGPSIRLGFTNERLMVPTAKIGPIDCPPCSEYKATTCRYSTVEFTNSYYIFMSHLECGGGLQNERWPVERKELVNVLALLRSEEEEEEEEVDEEEELVNVPLLSSEEYEEEEEEEDEEELVNVSLLSNEQLSEVEEEEEQDEEELVNVRALLREKFRW